MSSSSSVRPPVVRTICSLELRVAYLNQFRARRAPDRTRKGIVAVDLHPHPCRSPAQSLRSVPRFGGVSANDPISHARRQVVINNRRATTSSSAEVTDYAKSAVLVIDDFEKLHTICRSGGFQQFIESDICFEICVSRLDCNDNCKTASAVGTENLKISV